VVWAKYSCNKTTQNIYIQTTRPTIGISQLTTVLKYNTANATIFYRGYDFDESSGYTGYNRITISGITPESTSSDVSSLVGSYDIYGTEVLEVTGISSYSHNGNSQYLDYGMKVTVNVKTVGYAELTTIEKYSQGSTSYGFITTYENELPEEGALVDGSISGDHCILEINGTYYYYQRID
jgi:hypothetical protein